MNACLKRGILSIALLLWAVPVTADQVYVLNSYIHSRDATFSVVLKLRSEDLSLVDSVQIPAKGAKGFALTRDGRQLWVTNPPANTISVINTYSMTLARTISFRGPVRRPTGVAVTPDGRHVYVTYWSTGQVGVFDAQTYRNVQTIEVATKASFITFTPDGSKAYLVVYDPPEVVALRTSDHQVVARMAFPGNSLQDAVVSPSGLLYVINMDRDRIEVIRTEDDRVLFPIKTAYSLPRAVGMERQGGYLFVGHCNFGSETSAWVTKVSLKDRTRWPRQAMVLGSAEIPRNPRALVVSSDGRRVYVSEHDEDQCYAYDVRGRQITQAAVANMNTVRGFRGAAPMEIAVWEGDSKPPLRTQRTQVKKPQPRSLAEIRGLTDQHRRVLQKYNIVRVWQLAGMHPKAVARLLKVDLVRAEQILTAARQAARQPRMMNR